jgi:hypothetical protein
MFMRLGSALIPLGAAAIVGVMFASAARTAVLTATSSSQRIQNLRADEDDLSRMENAAMVQRFARAHLLSPVPASTNCYYLYQVSPQYRYLRPWAKLFLDRLSRQYHARFGARIRVTALVRTTAYQRALARRNVNAAPAVGPDRSSHLTGATLDMSKRFMKANQAGWMRDVLCNLHSRQVIYAVEERAAFHVMVHKSYRDYVLSLES